MKPFIKTAFIFIPFLCCQCTYVSHPVAGKYASLGGDTLGHKQDASGFSFRSNRNSPAFVKLMDTVEKMWKNYLLLQGLEFALGKYYTHEGKLVDASTTVKLEELRNAKSVADAEAALKMLQATPIP